MRLQGRNLRSGLTGGDVGQLHDELRTLGFDLPDAERTGSAFGSGTAAAVEEFQRSHGLAPTGVVDEATAAQLGRAVGQLSEATTFLGPSPRPASGPSAAGTPDGGAEPARTERPADVEQAARTELPGNAGPPVAGAPSEQPAAGASDDPTASTPPGQPDAAERPDASATAAVRAAIGDADAATVHRALAAMGVEVSEDEQQQGRLGPSTRAAVSRLQAVVGLAPTGELDEMTLVMARAVLDRLGERGLGAVAGMAWSIDGTVTDTNGVALAGVVVTAIRRQLRDGTPIGSARTDAAGRYRIEYPALDESPDLQFQVADPNGKPLFESTVYHRVEAQARIALALGGPDRTAAPEYTAMGAALARRLGGLHPEELVEDTRHKDITFLAGDTGHGRDTIALYAVAARMARTTGLPSDLFYALLRQKVPADAEAAVLAATSEGVDLDRNAGQLLKAILTASPQARSTAIAAAVAAQVISPDYAARAEQDLARLAQLSADAALNASHGMGKTSMSAVLNAAQLPVAQQEKFVALFTATARPTKSFWRRLAANPDFTKEQVATMRFATDVGRVTRGHLPLVQELLNQRGSGAIKGTRDLARLSADDWEALVGSERDGQVIGIPANLTAQDAEQAVKAYAYLLERRFERMHPTTAYSARLAADANSPLAEKDAVAAFLDRNPAFSLPRSNLDRFLVAHPQEVGEQLRESVLTSQRMIKLADRYAVAKPLLADRIQSAQQIYAMGRSQFMAEYGGHADVGPAQAARVFNLSEQTYALSMALVMNVNASMIGVGPIALGPSSPSSPSAPAPAPAPPDGGPAQPAVADMPNLQTLFGSLDMCACSHCRSVLSPAAYLVDMLQFLSKRKTAGVSARQVLFARRPDLAQIELGCANTNTVLPYIDLVNELLEDAVAPPADPVAAARARQTTLTTDELNANPEHVNATAYATLASAVYPWQLPFDLPLAEARSYLGVLGTDRVALIRTFGTPDDVTMAVEGLGLSAFEADIITGGTLAGAYQPWDYWGLDENTNTVADPVDPTISYSGTWLQVLANVRILLDRSGLSYTALTELLTTRFVNPDAAVTLVDDPEEPCDVQKMTVDGLTADVADRLHRFVRLQRRLGWNTYDTDEAIAGLQSGTPAGLARLNTTLLRQLYAVTTAMTALRAPVAVALTLFAAIGTREVAVPGQEQTRHSLYHDLFQNRIVLNPVDPAFALDAGGTELATLGSTLAEHRPALVAAFELADADLMLAITALTDGTLTLANLSRLHRAVVLARGLGVALPDLLRLLTLIEHETTATPFYETVDPFDPVRPQLLRAFCDEVERLRRTRFTVADLEYLLCHTFDPSSGDTPDDVAIGTLLKSVRDKLAKLSAEQAPSAYTELGKGVVIQELAEALTLPTATVAATGTLATDWLALPDVARDPSLTDLPIERDEAGFGGYFNDYVLLAKFAAVIARFGFTAEETAWLRVHGVAAGWLDPSALPLTATATAEGRYARWRRLADAAAVKTGMPSDGTPFTTLMDLADGGADKASYMDALHRRTQWSSQTLAVLAGDPANTSDTGLLQLAYPLDFQAERALARIVQAVGVLRRLGITADVGGWLGATVSPQQADAIKQSVKAKYSTARWAAVAKSLRDTLRERQRDALVGYLLAHPPAGVKRWHDSNDVYARYLIDVDMSSCQGTSRIVQANASIQLFVQRCILNLEPGVLVDAEADEDWLQWKWMSRYRVWEANRKVFCYPENWIEPSLRPEKSPFYRELENDLLQSEVTKDSAEDALRGYLEKMAAIARLDIAGVFHEVRSEDAENATTLHVVGRRQGHPPTFYYRQWIDSSRWTPWTKIELDITSDHVLPVVWNRRLYLFWAVANRKPDQTQENPAMQPSAQAPPPAKTHLEVQLAWSEFKGNKWQPTQTAPQTLVFTDDVDAYEVTLRSQIVDPLLRVDLFTKYGTSRVHTAEFVLGGVGNSVEAYLNSTSGLSSVGPHTRGIGAFGTGMNRGSLYAPTNSKFDAMTLVPAATTFESTMRPRITACNTTYDLYGTLTSETVLNRADRYHLLVPHQQLWFDSSLPFFYADSRRSYFVVPTRYYKSGNYFVTTAPASVYQPVYKPRYLFAPNYHAYVGLFLRELNRGGIDRLYHRALQLDPASVQAGKPTAPFSFKSYYTPTDNVLKPYPVEGVDFERHAGYSLYNWELFFHVPFAIADGLSRNQRFEEAKHWYEYIFNPTSTTKDPLPQRYWVTKPFYQMTAGDYWQQRIDNLMKLINSGDKGAEEQVTQWRRNPFEPHIIAGLRPVAYQRAIVMRYIDNLIAWGDQLFRQDTMESVNEATQLYVLAAELLGPKPEIVPRGDDAAPMTYADMADSLDAFSNVVAAAENVLPPVKVQAPVDPDIPKLPVLPPLYFCIEPNEQLLGYWDKVADRLYKVRHCMNIEGVVRQLALFAPPIDPGMLVKAAAAGLDLGSVLNDSTAPLPPYRFRVLLREAIELARTVQGLGAELTAALQLRDANKLDVLRSSAEKKLQNEIRDVHTKSVAEAAQQIEILSANRDVVKLRQDYYGGLTQELMNGWEIAAMAMTGGSIVAQGIAMAMEGTSGAAHAVVDVQFGGSGMGGSPHATVKFGGANVGNAAAAVARISKIVAAALQTGAQMASITAQYQRRKDDWQFQADQAGADLKVIDGQLAAAAIRQEIAAKNEQNHEIVAATAASVDEFLREKFTNAELYDWMVAQTSATYFQAYQLAYAVAKRAERCFRRELGLRDSSYIQFGYWDSLKKGLKTADKLLHDLHRMEAAFLAQHERDLELTKHVSLLQLDPYALVQLRTTGECTVHLPEVLFDLDNPGHYQRTIKSVGVSVPCVVGPYTGVPLTLTLMDNHIRDSVSTSPQYARQPGDDLRFVDDAGGMQAIVTSSAQNDSGMFERHFDDDRYLPFEGAGAISTWKLRLNPVYPQFDYRTISDVVLHLNYTARDGGATLAGPAAAAVKATLNQVALAESRTGLYRLLSVRQEYAAQWQQFLHPAGSQDQTLVVPTPPELFAFFTNGMDIKVTGVDVVAKLADPGDYTLVLTRPGGAPVTAAMTSDPLLGGLHQWSQEHLSPGSPIGRAPSSGPPPQWTVKLQKAGAADFRSLAADEIDDVVLILRYEVTP